jgi:hypothetical protein
VKKGTGERLKRKGREEGNKKWPVAVSHMNPQGSINV